MQKHKAPFSNILEHEDSNVSSTASALGANVIVASPGLNRHIVVTSFVIQNETAQSATTMILQDGPGHDAWRYLGVSQGDSLAMNFPANHPWKLRENQPLVLDLSAANTCGYSIQYYIEVC